MAVNNNTFTEKVIMSVSNSYDDTEKNRRIEFKRVNHNFQIVSKRWSEKYKNYELKPTCRLSVSWTVGSIAILALMNSAIAEMGKQEFTADMNGKTFYEDGVKNNKGEEFSITGKVLQSGEKVIFLSLDNGDMKDFVRLDLLTDIVYKKENVKSWLAPLEYFTNKLSAYIYDPEANDKFIARMMKSEKEGTNTTEDDNDDEKQEKPSDDFPF